MELLGRVSEPLIRHGEHSYSPQEYEGVLSIRLVEVELAHLIIDRDTALSIEKVK